MAYDFDIIVIGSGAGGGTFAYSCARAGKRVLLLERGRKYELPQRGHNEQEMLIDKKPYDDRPIEVNGKLRSLYVGGVLGGSTSLYGAALLRPSEGDFHPGQHYGDRIPRAIWDWPIGYDSLEPYYDEAETLYGVSGCNEDDFGPLHKPMKGFAARPIPNHPINRRLIKASRARGLKPFRLPLAIDFDRCLQCPVCPGYVCPNGSRRSSAQLLDKALADRLPLQLMTNVDVESLGLDTRGRIDAVHVCNRATGERSVYRAQRYALAAGAISSAALLLKSGMSGALLGRNYMFHLAPMSFGFFSRPTGADTAFVKQLGFADYYHGTKAFPHKLGLVQSLPVPGPLMIAKALSLQVPNTLVEMVRKRVLPLLGIVEDLPNPANCVALNGNGQTMVRHRFGRYDCERGRQLGRLMKSLLRRAGAFFCAVKSSPSHEHAAHQCGTLRFGNQPSHAVLDPNCRMFAQPNTFVVDGSFLPTSLGVGPALTIIANALRVARIAVQEM